MTAETQPPAAQVHQSLCKPQLMMGCDRELFLILCLLTVYVGGPMGFIAGRPWVGAVAVVCFILGKRGLGRLAKADPQMKTVFSRCMAYKNFYPAVCRSSATDRIVFRRWR